MADEFSEPTEPEILDPEYITQYHQHVSQVRSHLSGSDGDPLPPSYIPPAGCWTSSEKDAFFHALCIYSRLRPDLIADCIKTKTIVDVCAYIDVLDQAASENVCNFRGTLECALEVSDAWIEMEEEETANVIATEVEWEAEELKKTQKEESKVKKTALRNSKSPSWREEYNVWKKEQRIMRVQRGVLQSLDKTHLKVLNTLLREAGKGVIAPVDDISPQSTASHAPLASPCDQSCSNSLQPSLSPRINTAQLDVILPSVMDDEMIDPALRDQNAPLEIRCSSQALAGGPLRPLPSNRPELQGAPLDPHFTLPSTHVAPPVEIRQTGSRTPEPGEKDIDEIADVLSPASRRRYRKMIYMRRKRAEQAGRHTISVDLEHIGPGRKTEHKRMGRKSRTKMSNILKNKLPPAASEELNLSPTVGGHMTVEPGDIAGEDPTAMVVDVDAKVHVFIARQDGSQPQTPPEEGRRGGNRENNSLPKVSGITLPYKIKKKLAGLQIDANTLRNSDLDLLNMSLLGRIILMYQSLHSDIPDDVASHISADAIRLLTAYVVEFTTELVKYTIISQQQEWRLKGNSKVWKIRQLDQVRIQNVNHALNMMGVSALNKRDVFAGLEERFDLDLDENGRGSGARSKRESNVKLVNAAAISDEDSSEVDDEGNQSDEEINEDQEDEAATEDERENDDEDEGETNNQKSDEMQPLPLPLQRELFVPFVRFPPHVPEYFELSLMSTETDDDALLEELHAEEELDERDVLAARKYETALWRALRSSGNDGENERNTPVPDSP